VPVWKGTGYFYKRHRPGLVGVSVFLIVFASAVHYLLLWVGKWTQVARIQEELDRREVIKKKKKKVDELKELEEIENVSIESPRLSQVIGWQLVKLTWWMILFIPRKAMGKIAGNAETLPQSKEPISPSVQNKSVRRRKKEKEKESWSLADET